MFTDMHNFYNQLVVKMILLLDYGIANFIFLLYVPTTTWEKNWAPNSWCCEHKMDFRAAKCVCCSREHFRHHK